MEFCVCKNLYIHDYADNYVCIYIYIHIYMFIFIHGKSTSSLPIVASASRCQTLACPQASSYSSNSLKSAQGTTSNGSLSISPHHGSPFSVNPGSIQKTRTTYVSIHAFMIQYPTGSNFKLFMCSSIRNAPSTN